MINKLPNTALNGLQRNNLGLRNTANDIARYPLKTGKNDFNRSLLQLKQHEQAAKANVQSLKTADELVGTLLDVKA